MVQSREALKGFPNFPKEIAVLVQAVLAARYLRPSSEKVITQVLITAQNTSIDKAKEVLLEYGVPLPSPRQPVIILQRPPY